MVKNIDRSKSVIKKDSDISAARNKYELNGIL